MTDLDALEQTALNAIKRACLSNLIHARKSIGYITKEDIADVERRYEYDDSMIHTCVLAECYRSFESKIECLDYFRDSTPDVTWVPDDSLEQSDLHQIIRDSFIAWRESEDVIRNILQGEFNPEFLKDALRSTKRNRERLISRYNKRFYPRELLTQWLKPDGYVGDDNPYFKYIDYMIDLRNPETRKLLPYLLTAYTCNSPRNQFSVRRDTNCPSAAEQWFDPHNCDEDLICSKAIANEAKKLDKLKDKFTLTGYSIHEQKKRRTNQTGGIELLERNRPFQDPLFVESIFKLWCIVITDYEDDDKFSQALSYKLTPCVNIGKSYELFLNRLNLTIPNSHRELFVECADNNTFCAAFQDELDEQVFL